HLGRARVGVKVRLVLIDRFIEQRKDVLVEKRAGAFRRGRDLLFYFEEVFGRSGQRAAQFGGGCEPEQRCGEHQRMLARRGRSTLSRTNSRTRRAMPSGCRSYCARSTSCAP